MSYTPQDKIKYIILYALIYKSKIIIRKEIIESDKGKIHRLSCFPMGSAMGTKDESYY